MSTIINGGTGRILCVSDIRGDYNNLNKMIEENKAVAVIHTGDFGFLDGGSSSRMMPRLVRFGWTGRAELRRGDILGDAIAASNRLDRSATMTRVNSTFTFSPL
jgi:hypothetical protein